MAKYDFQQLLKYTVTLKDAKTYASFRLPAISLWRSVKLHEQDNVKFLTFLSHICKGLLPILYSIDKNPLWNVFLNIL